MSRALFLTGLFIAALAFLDGFAADRRGTEQINVFVSILPQKYFVERIGGNRVRVSVMVGPGQSHETYEPLPQQMLDLGKAELFYRIGVSFEDSWMERIASLYPHARIIDTRRGIPLRRMESFEELRSAGERRTAGQHAHGHDGLDPHIWLSPRLVKIQASSIASALTEADPGSGDYYHANLAAFHAELDALSAELQKVIDRVQMKKLLVFHPAWGYFADQFGLQQIPIEMEGKEPSPKQLTEVISYALENKIRVIFVQAQISSRTVKAIADEINGTAITIDPLAENYVGNLKAVAETIARNLQ